MYLVCQVRQVRIQRQVRKVLRMCRLSTLRIRGMFLVQQVVVTGCFFMI